MCAVVARDEHACEVPQLCEYDELDRRGFKRYRGKAYDSRARRHLAGPWTRSLAEARGWRTDALAAIKAGTRTAAAGPTLRVALRRFFEGMRSGQVRNRSGRIYKPSVCRSYEAAYRLYLDRELGPHQGHRRAPRRDPERRGSAQHDPRSFDGENALMPLRAYFRWSLARGVVPTNPTTGLEVPASEGRRDRIATPAEARELIDALAQKDRALWVTLFYAGLRMGEARGLTIEDIDLVKRVLRVRRSWDPHAGSVEPKSAAGNRSAPIPNVLQHHLVPHLESQSWIDGLAFGRTPDVSFSPQAVTQRAYRVWKKAGSIGSRPTRSGTPTRA